MWKMVWENMLVIGNRRIGVLVVEGNYCEQDSWEKGVSEFIDIPMIFTYARRGWWPAGTYIPINSFEKSECASEIHK